MRNIFVKKPYTKCGGETIPKPFSQKSKFYAVCFIVCQFEGYRNTSKPSCRPLAFTLYKAFLKSKHLL